MYRRPAIAVTPTWRHDICTLHVNLPVRSLPTCCPCTRLNTTYQIPANTLSLRTTQWAPCRVGIAVKYSTFDTSFPIACTQHNKPSLANVYASTKPRHDISTSANCCFVVSPYTQTWGSFLTALSMKHLKPQASTRRIKIRRPLFTRCIHRYSSSMSFTCLYPLSMPRHDV
ncbi:hypothetical protein B0H34DRAFT_735294 [Crassisporium funariophilum]|nr:hypothetical protein B0H34DRAFT_735294 [Crassisporium funariophilum]